MKTSPQTTTAPVARKREMLRVNNIVPAIVIALWFVLLVIFLNRDTSNYVETQTYECWNSKARVPWKIAVLTSATAQYRQKLLQPFLASFERYFFPHDKVDFYVFVDEALQEKPNLKQFIVPHRPWGEASMARWAYMLSINETLAGYDYVVWADVDIVVREFICDNYFGFGHADLIGVSHPQQAIENVVHAPFEDRPHAASYVAPEKRKQYLTGSQYAARPAIMQEMAGFCQKLKELDASHGISPKIVDESQYLHFIHYKRWPDVILSPSYNYPPTEWEKYEVTLGAIPKLIIHGGKPW